MSTDHRLLMIFAHPDDESFGFAGTMLALADAGVQMSLIVATRGEEGEILVPGLATKENLGEVREGELRAAMKSSASTTSTSSDIGTPGCPTRRRITIRAPS